MKDVFDENEVGFSIDENLTLKAHFYANDNGRRLKVCVVDRKIILILCCVWFWTIWQEELSVFINNFSVLLHEDTFLDNDQSVL